MEEKKRFIKISGKLIEVTEEVYHVYKQPAWKERQRKRREAAAGKTPYSLEQMWEDGLDVADSTQDVEKAVMKKELIDAMYKAIDELDPDERIIVLLYSEGASDHKISDQIGIPQTTVSYRRKVAFNTLRKKLKDYQ